MTRSLVLASVLACSGCTTTRSLRPDSLMALDGFDAATPEGRSRVAEEDGTKVEYPAGRGLVIRFSYANGLAAEGEFVRIDAQGVIRPGLLSGTLRGGGVLTIDVTTVRSAAITQFSLSRTVVLVAILAALTAGTVALVNAGLRAPLWGGP